MNVIILIYLDKHYPQQIFNSFFKLKHIIACIYALAAVYLMSSIF